MIHVPAIGPAQAKILIVVDFPSVEAERKGTPLAGSEASLLSSLLHEAGILYSEVRIAYLCDHRPYASQSKYLWTQEKAEARFIPISILHKGAYCAPSFLESARALEAEIERVQPNVIVALGEASLHYLTGEKSISKWREAFAPTKVSPARSSLSLPTPRADSSRLGMACLRGSRHAACCDSREVPDFQSLTTQ